MLEITQVVSDHMDSLHRCSDTLLDLGNISERVEAGAKAMYDRLQALAQTLPKVAERHNPTLSTSEKQTRLWDMLQTLEDELNSLEVLACNASRPSSGGSQQSGSEAPLVDDDGYDDFKTHCARVDAIESSFRQFLKECSATDQVNLTSTASMALVRKTKHLPWNIGQPFMRAVLGSAALVPAHVLGSLRKALDPIKMMHEALRKAAMNLSAVVLCGLGMYYSGVLGRVDDGLYFLRISLAKLEGKQNIQRAYVLHIAAELSPDFEECKEWFRETKAIMESLPETPKKESWTTLLHWVTSRLVVYLTKEGSWDEATQLLRSLLGNISRRMAEPMTEATWKRYVREGGSFSHGRENTMYQIARSLYVINDFLACEELLSAFVQIAPKDHFNRNGALVKQACCLIRLDRTPEADKILKRLDDSVKTKKKAVVDESRFALACKLIYDERLQEAEALMNTLDVVLRQRSDYHRALCHAIYGMYKVRRYHDARAAIRDGDVFLNVRSSRHKGWILVTLLWVVLMAQGKNREVVEWCNKALPIFGDKFGRSHWRYMETLNVRAKVLVELGDTAAAVEDLTKIVDILKGTDNLVDDDMQCYQRWRCISRLATIATGIVGQDEFLERDEFDKATRILIHIQGLRTGARTCTCRAKDHYYEKISERYRRLRRLIRNSADSDWILQIQQGGCGGLAVDLNTPLPSPLVFKQAES